MEDIKIMSDSTQSEIDQSIVETKKSPQKKRNLLSKEIQKDLPETLTPEELRRERSAETRLRLRREWEVESQMVTGVFRDLEVGPGGNLRFSARKYPWDQVASFNFVDGQTYTIPLWVARHLNENCKWPAYRHNIDPSAKEGEKVTQYIGQWNHRFAFVSSDFTNIVKSESPAIIGVQR
jgi:hypothetical protein